MHRDVAGWPEPCWSQQTECEDTGQEDDPLMRGELAVLFNKIISGSDDWHLAEIAGRGAQLPSLVGLSGK